MADKDWKKRLEAIGNSPMDETSQRIMAGIEASKKRNAELAKDVDKRRAEYEAKQKAAKTQQTTAETRPKKSPSVPTKVRSSKGGAMTAEVDDTAVKRQKATSKAAEQKKSQSASSGEGKITPKQSKTSAIDDYYKTSGANKEARGDAEMRRRGGRNYGRLKVTSTARIRDAGKSIRNFLTTTRGLTVSDIRKSSTEYSRKRKEKKKR